jgi:hypothetical protein
MMQRLRNISSILFALLAAGCISPYEPPPMAQDQRYLVVDGFLNPTAGSAEVVLKYTTPLDSDEQAVSESSAVVSIYDEDNIQVILSNRGNGEYSISGAAFPNERRYRLHIATSGGKQYQSELVNPVSTPEIDSLNFIVEPDRLHINVNTHDPSGGSIYYRWFSTETYEYRSDYFSGYTYRNGIVTVKTKDEFINRCWRTDALHDIRIRSTESLTEDRVTNFTLRTIQRDNIRISYKYSLLVRQQTLTEDAFRYWVNVKETTENLGGLFDPVPSQVIGNIRCISDPSEPVIGFFSAGSVTEKRIFIDRDDLPTNYSRYDMDCVVDTLDLDMLPYISNPDALLYPFYSGPSIIGWATTTTPCFDCRVLGGGTTTEPDFWE